MRLQKITKFLLVFGSLVAFSARGAEGSGLGDIEFELQYNGRELNIEVESAGNPHDMTIREVGQSSRWITISQNDFKLITAQVSEMKRITRQYQEAGRLGRKNCRTDHFSWLENGKESFLCLDGLGTVEENGPVRIEKLRKTQNIAREMIYFLQRAIAETETPVALLPPRRALGNSVVQDVIDRGLTGSGPAQSPSASLGSGSGNRALRTRNRTKQNSRSRQKLRPNSAERRR